MDNLCDLSSTYKEHWHKGSQRATACACDSGSFHCRLSLRQLLVQTVQIVLYPGHHELKPAKDIDTAVIETFNQFCCKLAKLILDEIKL